MYILVALGFIVFLILLSGNWGALKPILLILAIPFLIWIFLRLFMVVGVAFRSGVVGGLLLALAGIYLFKTLKK